MSVSASFSSPTTAPSGAGADSLSPSHLFLLLIVRILIIWAEGLVTALQNGTDAPGLAGVMRHFGTTDRALALERVNDGLRRLYALEADILRHGAGHDADPQLGPMAAAESTHRRSAPRPHRLKPEDARFFPLPTSGHIVAAQARATGPPEP